MENNKTMILSILGVLVLVIAVVGVSFAMYSFSAQGLSIFGSLRYILCQTDM